MIFSVDVPNLLGKKNDYRRDRRRDEVIFLVFSGCAKTTKKYNARLEGRNKEN